MSDRVVPIVKWMRPLHLAAESGPLTISEVAVRTMSPRKSAYRQVHVLVKAGYLALYTPAIPDPRSQRDGPRYTVGPLATELAKAILESDWSIAERREVVETLLHRASPNSSEVARRRLAADIVAALAVGLEE